MKQTAPDASRQPEPLRRRSRLKLYKRVPDSKPLQQTTLPFSRRTNLTHFLDPAPVAIIISRSMEPRNQVTRAQIVESSTSLQISANVAVDLDARRLQDTVLNTPVTDILKSAGTKASSQDVRIQADEDTPRCMESDNALLQSLPDLDSDDRSCNAALNGVNSALLHTKATQGDVTSRLCHKAREPVRGIGEPARKYRYPSTCFPSSACDYKV